MSALSKLCPRCRSIRFFDEIFCEGIFGEKPCRYSLSDVPARRTSEIEAELAREHAPRSIENETVGTAPIKPFPAQARTCRNGHPLEAGDFLCQQCGEGPQTTTIGAAPSALEEATASRTIGSWRIERELEVVSGEADLFFVGRNGGSDQEAIAKLFRRGIEPETDLYPALFKVDADFSARLYDVGRHDGRPFEVWEYMPYGSLGQLSEESKAKPDFVKNAVGEIAKAIMGLEAVGVRHRDLKPANILIRSLSPLDLVLADFGTAVLGEFDLQMTVVRQTTRYSAPETIIGTYSSSSDWWSLGVITLELLCGSKCFEGVHDKAFLLHLITRGIEVPRNLSNEWKELLMGLLTRDHARRWRWPEVNRWLGGERGIPNSYHLVAEGAASGKGLRLNDKTYTSPNAFAFAAAEASNWQAATDLLERGLITDWLNSEAFPKDLCSNVRRIATDTNLTWDQRLALSLLVLNQDLPLCLKGEVVNPTWLLSNVSLASSWVSGSVPRHLKRLERELWFVRLRERVDRIRARLEEYRIPYDPERLQVLQLTTLISTLEDKWKERRSLFPEASHPVLAALYERRTLSEDDLIILLAASISALRPQQSVMEEAQREAKRIGLSFDNADAVAWFAHSRSHLFDELNKRLENFCVCGLNELDRWADQFRLERRLALPKVLLLLLVPPQKWTPPPQQAYIRNILSFFERKLVSSIQRGPLVRLLTSTSNIDLTELGSSRVSASALLSAVINRRGDFVRIDPLVFADDAGKESRLHRLKERSVIYSRETGIEALFLGFPFVVLRQTAEALPRIAPVFLWPLKVNVPTGQRGVGEIAFDKDREEVRLNPALNFLLNQEMAATLEEIRQEALSSSDPEIAALMENLSRCGMVGGKQLTKVPGGKTEIAVGRVRFECSAAIFMCDFSGQTIAQDLKTIGTRGIAGTALEVMIKAAEYRQPDELAGVPEKERFFTAEADPSQTRAVFRARHAPGLIVQGPPGTGKSQTIVNTICDCLGRSERVLVVCQKPAALEVVRKRLVAEGLGNRLFYLKDPSKDRKAALESLRNQLEQVALTDKSRLSALRTTRETMAERVAALEAELNKHHEALHGYDQGTGLSYKEILSELIQCERGVPPVAAPRLRLILSDSSVARVEGVCEEVGDIAQPWLHSKWETSSLRVLAEFVPDSELVASLWSDFGALILAEREREQRFKEVGNQFVQVSSVSSLQKWTEADGLFVQKVSEPLAKDTNRWGQDFRSSSGVKGDAHIATLSSLSVSLNSLSPAHYNEKWAAELLSMTDQEVRELSSKAKAACEPVTNILGRLRRFFVRRKVFEFLGSRGLEKNLEQARILQLACELELALRPVRNALKPVVEALRSALFGPSLTELRDGIARLVSKLNAVKKLVSVLESAPVEPSEIDALLSQSAPEAYHQWFDASRRTVIFLQASYKSLERLDAVKEWFTPVWFEETRNIIQSSAFRLERLECVVAQRATLEAFQNFRLRVNSLSEVTLSVLKVLREQENIWGRIPNDKLGGELQRTIRREAFLAWKERYERVHPAILLSKEDFERKTKSLREADKKFREINRDFLAMDLQGSIASRGRWDDVTKFHGRNAKRLREFIELAEPLGLFSLRPIWLLNPDMVSRLFALKACLFDVVVFDEASQLPVASALPALFRAKRVIVSGDEKQMPPSNFFSSRLQNDEAEDEFSEPWLDDEEGKTDPDLTSRREAKENRKEVKDKEDLLELANGILPSETLEVHYRSRFRELIGFSNAAFYKRRLSVPAQHPEHVVRTAKPLEIFRTDSVYTEQTNVGEATKIVQVLSELWRRPFESRPSVGVVTFNLAQSELIWEYLEEFASRSKPFREELERERAREVRGEDMSFFVKNLENVQGDERDWIIFSTTFGRDPSGRFLRNFGALIHDGGERRLNVAITRAKEKVLLVTSMPINEVSNFVNGHRLPNKPRDYLQAYLDYAQKVSDGELALAESSLRHVSSDHPLHQSATPELNGGLASEVADVLTRHGHHFVRPDNGDAFAVDFAIIDPKTKLFKLGIECDSPRHPLLAEARGRELWRQDILSGSLTGVYRVWSRFWHQNRSEESKRLLEVVSRALDT